MSARSRLRDLSASATKQQNLNVWYALRSLSWSYDGETSSSCTRRASKYRALGGTALARASSRENISSWSTSEVEDEDEEAGWREEGSNGGRGGCVKAVSQSGSHFNTRDSVGEEEGKKEMEEREELEDESKEEKDIELLVYAELSSIRDKLKTQLQLLAEEELRVQRETEDLREREVAQKQTEEALNRREEALRAREKALVCREVVAKSREEKLFCREGKVIEVERLACEVHRSLAWCVEQEKVKAEGESEEEAGKGAEVARLQGCVRKKSGEVYRLRLLFDGAKQAKENFKSELQEAQEKNLKLQSQLSLVRSRLASEQRKNEQLVSKLQQQQQQQITSEASEYSVDSLVSTEKNKKCPRQTPVDLVYSDLLATVMQWLCRVHLSRLLSSAQLTEVQQLSSQVLPSLAFLLPHTVSHSQGLQLPVLELVYWCVAHLSTKQQKSALVSTLRRIGETIYKPLAFCGDEGGKRKMWSSQAFCTSRDCHSRTLSCLLALQTLTQVDRLAQVFEQLKECLKEELGREVFLTYCGVQDVLPFLSPANRVLCNHAVDTYLLLSTGSTLLPHFLAACCTDQWFTACTALLKHTPDIAKLEKISILLQRLSKEKSSRYLFEGHRVVGMLEDLLQTEAGCSSHFLSLNLHSTLINLGHKPPPVV